jgi:hypothetical protein
MLSIGLGLFPPFQGVLRANFLAGMPAGSTYTRTGEGTGRTSAAVLTLFAANAAQRTNRGLALDPARTNLLVNSLLAGGTVPTSWTRAGATGVTTVVANAFYPAGVALQQSGTAQREFLQQGITLPTGLATLSIYVNAASSLTANDALALFGATAVMDAWTYPACPANPSGGAAGVLGVGRFDCQANVTSAGTATARVGVGVGANATGSITWSIPQVESGTFATSYIPTAGASAARGLPVFTEPVPLGYTRALLTYADNTTTTATGLTPGGTFDVVTHVLANSKGRFGASELVMREWLA